MPTTIDVVTMSFFVQFYTTTLNFIFYRLYTDQGFKYPPTLDSALLGEGHSIHFLIFSFLIFNFYKSNNKLPICFLILIKQIESRIERPVKRQVQAFRERLYYQSLSLGPPEGPRGQQLLERKVYSQISLLFIYLFGEKDIKAEEWEAAVLYFID